MPDSIASVIPPDGLRVRSAPSTDGKVLGSLTQGETVTITGSAGLWRAVECRLGAGFVHGDFITLDGVHSVNEAVTPAPNPAVPATHTVVANDTLSGIGAALGIPWRSIAAANGLTEPFALRIGQVLVLPGAAVHETVVASANTGTMAVMNPLSTSGRTRVTSSSNQGHHTPYGGNRSCDVALLGRNSQGATAHFDLAAPPGIELRGVVDVIGLACASGRIEDGGHKVQLAIHQRPAGSDTWSDTGAWVLYAHIDPVSVATGDQVLPGDAIGILGPPGGGQYNSSCAQGSHTHVEVRGAQSVVDEGQDIDRDAVMQLAL
jgi:LysM repeat protein